MADSADLQELGEEEEEYVEVVPILQPTLANPTAQRLAHVPQFLFTERPLTAVRARSSTWTRRSRGRGTR